MNSFTTSPVSTLKRELFQKTLEHVNGMTLAAVVLSLVGHYDYCLENNNDQAGRANMLIPTTLGALRKCLLRDSTKKRQGNWARSPRMLFKAIQKLAGRQTSSADFNAGIVDMRERLNRLSLESAELKCETKMVTEPGSAALSRVGGDGAAVTRVQQCPLVTARNAGHIYALPLGVGRILMDMLEKSGLPVPAGAAARSADDVLSEHCTLVQEDLVYQHKALVPPEVLRETRGEEKGGGAADDADPKVYGILMGRGIGKWYVGCLYARFLAPP
jgi:hypothetical protein